jgi:ankyrin repeat protein
MAGQGTAASPEVRRRAVRKRPDALATAAEYHGAGALEALLAVGFDVDAAARDGRTALHQAALDGDAELCRWLLAHGADRTRTDAWFGGTPAGWAAHAGHDELAAELR